MNVLTIADENLMIESLGQSLEKKGWKRSHIIFLVQEIAKERARVRKQIVDRIRDNPSKTKSEIADSIEEEIY